MRFQELRGVKKKRVGLRNEDEGGESPGPKKYLSPRPTRGRWPLSHTAHTVSALPLTDHGDNDTEQKAWTFLMVDSQRAASRAGEIGMGGKKEKSPKGGPRLPGIIGEEKRSAASRCALSHRSAAMREIVKNGRDRRADGKAKENTRSGVRHIWRTRPCYVGGRGRTGGGAPGRERSQCVCVDSANAREGERGE